MRLIETILFKEPRGVLSLTGGGGKTSIMYHLARLLALSGKKVLTTTTTKIFFPEKDQSAAVIVAADPEVVMQQAASVLGGVCHVTAAAASLAAGDKLSGFPPEVIRTFVSAGLFDWIIVEADGAARRPLKAPAGHEPVIPSVTTVVVAVAGLDVIGKTLSEEHVFRAELAGKLMALDQEEIVTEAALARLLAHPEGGFKGAPNDALRVIFLNKADTAARAAAGDRIAALLSRTVRPVAAALIVGQARERINIHAVHRLQAVS